MAPDRNLDRLDAALRALGPLAEELCLVGGCAASLLISDTGASSMRLTEDVDMILESLHYAGYRRFCDKLEERGFSPSAEENDPICRWRHGDIVLDVMPLDEGILGFSNRWYRQAFQSRRALQTVGGHAVECVDGPHFLATKLDAFQGRGGGDFVTSHDLEDLVRVIDGRKEIVDELRASSAEVRQYVARGIRGCMEDRFFREALPMYLVGDTARLPILLRRVEMLVLSS